MVMNAGQQLKMRDASNSRTSKTSLSAWAMHPSGQVGLPLKPSMVGSWKSAPEHDDHAGLNLLETEHILAVICSRTNTSIVGAFGKPEPQKSPNCTICTIWRYFWCSMHCPQSSLERDLSWCNAWQWLQKRKLATGLLPARSWQSWPRMMLFMQAGCCALQR